MHDINFQSYLAIVRDCAKREFHRDGWPVSMQDIHLVFEYFKDGIPPDHVCSQELGHD